MMRLSQDSPKNNPNKKRKLMYEKPQKRQPKDFTFGIKEILKSQNKPIENDIYFLWQLVEFPDPKIYKETPPALVLPSIFNNQRQSLEEKSDCDCESPRYSV